VETQLSEIQEISKKRSRNSLLLLESKKKLLGNSYKSEFGRFSRNKASILENRSAAVVMKNEQR